MHRKQLIIRAIKKLNWSHGKGEVTSVDMPNKLSTEFSGTYKISLYYNMNKSYTRTRKFKVFGNTVYAAKHKLNVLDETL